MKGKGKNGENNRREEGGRGGEMVGKGLKVKRRWGNAVMSLGIRQTEGDP